MDPVQVETRTAGLETRVGILLWIVAGQFAVTLVMLAIMVVIAMRL